MARTEARRDERDLRSGRSRRLSWRRAAGVPLLGEPASRGVAAPLQDRADRLDVAVRGMVDVDAWAGGVAGDFAGGELAAFAEGAAQRRSRSRHLPARPFDRDQTDAAGGSSRPLAGSVRSFPPSLGAAVEVVVCIPKQVSGHRVIRHVGHSTMSGCNSCSLRCLTSHRTWDAREARGCMQRRALARPCPGAREKIVAPVPPEYDVRRGISVALRDC